MKTSLFSRILCDSDSDAGVLDAWLSERNADLRLDSLPDEPLPFTVDAERLAAAVAPRDPAVEPGQIRILSPSLVADDFAFPFVAVLDRWMADLWLVAPFSPYSTPATPGEMASGVQFAGRRVLQCWNARTAHESLVSQSRVVGVLGESVRKDALALFRHIASGTALPESFQIRVGPPILSTADPRRAYLVESTERFAPLTAAAEKREARLALEERIAGRREFLLKSSAFISAAIEAARPTALAAGDREKESSEAFLVPAFGVEMDVKYAPSEGNVRLVVYGPDGERDAKSLEGIAVVDKGGALVGTIGDGVLVAQASALADGFILVHPETLEPVVLELKGK